MKWLKQFLQGLSHDGTFQRVTPPEAETAVLIPGALGLVAFESTFDSISGRVRCMLYWSRGLTALGQKEVLIGLLLRPGETGYPGVGSMAGLFRMIHVEAGRGNLADVGGITGLAPESDPLFGRPDFRGVVYTDAGSVAFLAGVRKALLGVVVTTRELEIAHEQGHTRLLSRLGDRVRFFPTPPWSDRDRPEVLGEDFLSTSILREVPRMHLPGAAVWLEQLGEEVVHEECGRLPVQFWNNAGISLRLRMDRGSRDRWRRALMENREPFHAAILTLVPPDLPRCLTWVSGQVGTRSISDMKRREDRRCAANFLLLDVDETVAEDSTHLVEDGVALRLRPRTWLDFRASLEGGGSFRVNDAAGRSLLHVEATPR